MEEIDPGPVFKEGSIPPPSRRSETREGPESPGAQNPSQRPPPSYGTPPSRPSPNEARSTPGSTDPGSDDESDPEDLAQLGAVLISGLTKVANFISRRRGGTLTWSMTRGEAATVSRPLVRLLGRRFHVQGDVKDALDVGRSADSLLGYVLRVLSGAAGGDVIDVDGRFEDRHEERARAEAQAARSAQERYEATARQQAEANERARQRDEAARAAAQQSYEHGSEGGQEPDFFDYGMGDR